MTPDPAFVQTLKSYDRFLDVVWCEREPITGGLVQRWRVIRKAEDGRMRHIMFVQGPNREFLPLDNRVMEKLHRADSHRYLNADDLIRAFDAENDLAQRAGIRGVMERRYWDGIEELAAKMAWALRDSDTKPDEAALTKQLKQGDAKREVAAAYDRGKGVIVYDKDLECPVVVPGTDS